MPSEKIEKSVTFQSIRPTQCRCTDKEVCRYCKGKRRSVSFADAVRENNLEYLRKKGAE
jgi:hypothetical protein